MDSENNALLKYDGEDDTLGNLLRTYLLNNDDVIFAAYKVPHPLTRSVEVRVQSATIPITDLLQSTVVSRLFLYQ